METQIVFNNFYGLRQGICQFSITNRVYDCHRPYLELYSNQRLESLHILFCFLPKIEKWIAFTAMKGVRQLDLDLSQGFRDPRDGEFTDRRNLFKITKFIVSLWFINSFEFERLRVLQPIRFQKIL